MQSAWGWRVGVESYCAVLSRAREYKGGVAVSEGSGAVDAVKKGRGCLSGGFELGREGGLRGV